jgi:pimeloyl-ACP methyl ester carboxylesterase
MNTLKFGGSITLVCGTLMAFSGGPANAAPVKNIVLIHGAFADGSGWKAVYEILANDGYNVTAAQPPLTGPEDDIAPAARERMYAKRANSTTAGIEGASHSVYASHPVEVAKLIEDAPQHAGSSGRAPE